MRKKSIYISEKLSNDLKIISKNSKIRISDLVEGLIIDGLSKLDSINIQIIKKGTSFSDETEAVIRKFDSNESDFDEDEDDGETLHEANARMWFEEHGTPYPYPERKK